MILFPALLLRLSVALLLGALIGLEREMREHTAGMRTNALVALGSCLFTVISGFGFADLRNLPHTQLDPTRIASYVVAGVGFLGGGTIFFLQDKERVKGLTTAAAIWVVAAIGMACGAGLIWEAVSATILSLIVLIGLRVVEQRLMLRHVSQSHSITIEVSEGGTTIGQLLSQVYATCNRYDVAIERLDVGKKRNGEEIQGEIIKLVCHARDRATLTSAFGELRTLPDVRAIHADLTERKKE